jgi:phosphate transport system substrate-binding protein
MWQAFARLALYAAPVLLAAAGAILYFGGAAQNAASLSGSVQVVGSETMRPAVTACAEDFMTRNPQADVIVRGGGSGDGMAALLHGMTDVGMASRELSQRERDYASSNGMELATFALALDGVTVIVNRANPVATLGLDQLKDIFSGKVRSWSELGGSDAEIVPFARAAGSGTASLFGERVLRDERYGPSVRYLPTNEAIVAEVATRPGAIGYTGLGALRGGGDRVKALPLYTEAPSAPVAATPEAISTQRYPLSRTLYLVTAGHPFGTAHAFIDFCLSANGQAMFQRAGYIGIKPVAR